MGFILEDHIRLETSAGVFIGLYDISTDRWIYERTEIL